MFSRKVVIPLLSLASVIPAANAFTLYDNGEDKFEFYGRFGAQYEFALDDKENNLTSETSRFGFKANKKISDGLSVLGHAEFGISEQGEIEKRLAYGGFKTDYGSLTVGRQWGAVYQVVGGWTGRGRFDVMETSLTKGETGVGRTSGIVKYTYKDKKLHVQGQYIPENSETKFDSSYGLAASYLVTKQISLGLGHNAILFDDGTDDRSVSVLGVKYYNKKLYAAANFFIGSHWSKDFDYGDSKGLEFYSFYHLENNIRPTFQVFWEAADDSDAEMLYFTPGVEYHFVKNRVLVYAEYSIRSEKDDKGVSASDDDRPAVGFRYYW